MSGASEQNGYTIVEVMIFLAISGMMFVMAASFVNGKQSKTEFRQAMDDLNAQTQRVINDVDNGYYPTAGNFTCTSDGSGGQPVLIAAATAQGRNLGCVFSGKVIQYGVSGSGGTGYNIYSVAARQYVTTAALGKLPSNFSESKAVPIIDMSSPKLFDSTDRKVLVGGVRVTKVLSSGHPINGIGVYSNFANYDGSATLQSGSRSVIVVAIPGSSTTLNEDEALMVSEIINQTTDANILPSPDITICMEGGRGLYGMLKFGGNNGQRINSKAQITDQATFAAGGC